MLEQASPGDLLQFKLEPGVGCPGSTGLGGRGAGSTGLGLIGFGATGLGTTGTGMIAGTIGFGKGRTGIIAGSASRVASSRGELAFSWPEICKHEVYNENPSCIDRGNLTREWQIAKRETKNTRKEQRLRPVRTHVEILPELETKKSG